MWEGFNGVLEDISGGSVDEAGNLVDAEGNLIDMEGNRVDEEGYLLNENGERKVNDNGEYIKSENMETFSGETLPASESGEPVGDAVSNPDAPEPPQSSKMHYGKQYGKRRNHQRGSRTGITKKHTPWRSDI